jgi:hypothetical protein
MEAHDKDHWDEWLNRTLQQYGDAEPRPALETRIMASLANERSRVSAGWWWGLAFAGCLTTILALWLAHLDVLQLKRPIALNHRPETMHVGPVQEPHRRSKQAESGGGFSTTHKRTNHVIARNTNVSPRLEQFPSQRPLSEQERLLKQYVEQFPDEAMVAAKAQAETEKELQKLIADRSGIDLSEEER